MKKIIASLMAVFSVGIAAETKPPAIEQGNVMLELRQMALNLKPEEIRLAQSNYLKQVFGIIFETAYSNGSFSLVVLADGTVSLYFNTGGGIIGAGQHESVRRASANLLAGANQFYANAKIAKKFPTPEIGNSTFYFLTYGGVLGYSAKEIEPGEGRDKLSDLFHAAHYVISVVA
jgi:hypothetical protein